ncbi:MAG: RidA family protein [Syntrophomonadaceae bacterium]|nr:RidA family protein [Syntrophomonadaceae bacterium]
MDIEKRLRECGIVLPEVSVPLAAYLPAVRSGNLLFISGQLPMEQGVLAYKGRLGSELSIAEGQAACRLAAINCLAVLKNNLADWGQLVKIVKITGYIQCEAHFTELPLVLNGASQLLEDIFGEYGKHARVAVGVNALPLGAACEVEMLAELR